MLMVGLGRDRSALWRCYVNACYSMPCSLSQNLRSVAYIGYILHNPALWLVYGLPCLSRETLSRPFIFNLPSINACSHVSYAL
ncbi:hypothetical protein [Pantoea phage Nifs112]|nr:hypothetical protein [Pantoea phage Nifs112]